MKRKIAILILVGFFCVGIGIPAFALEDAPTPNLDTIISEITIGIPEIEGLRITMANVYAKYGRDISPKGSITYTFVFPTDIGGNTVSFNQDVVSFGIGTVPLKAGEKYIAGHIGSIEFDADGKPAWDYPTAIHLNFLTSVNLPPDLYSYNYTYPIVDLSVSNKYNLVAKPSASIILVNGESIVFDAYNISGNNYFKIRDIAYVLNGTEKQFSVNWDGASGAVMLMSARSYTAVGGEMESKGAGDKTPTPTTSRIMLDGAEISFTAYYIEGNNYFKLRDIGTAFNFGVEWESSNHTIIIDTGKDYTPE